MCFTLLSTEKTLNFGDYCMIAAAECQIVIFNPLIKLNAFQVSFCKCSKHQISPPGNLRKVGIFWRHRTKSTCNMTSELTRLPKPLAFTASHVFACKLHYMIWHFDLFCLNPLILDQMVRELEEKWTPVPIVSINVQRFASIINVSTQNFRNDFISITHCVHVGVLFMIVIVKIETSECPCNHLRPR